MFPVIHKGIPLEALSLPLRYANVWGALLSACRIHKNIHVGNRVWKKLLDMGISDCGTHVLTYNIYIEKLGGKQTQNKLGVGLKKKG